MEDLIVEHNPLLEEIAALRAKVERLKEALRAYPEWIEPFTGNPVCLACGGMPFVGFGHAPDCKRQLALKEAPHERMQEEVRLRV